MIKYGQSKVCNFCTGNQGSHLRLRRVYYPSGFDTPSVVVGECS